MAATPMLIRWLAPGWRLSARCPRALRMSVVAGVLQVGVLDAVLVGIALVTGVTTFHASAQSVDAWVPDWRP